VNHFDRLVQQAASSHRSLGNDDDAARMSLPLTWRWLTETEADKEHVKDPAKLTIRAVPDGFLASLSDECFGVSLDIHLTCLADLWTAVEEALKRQDAPWRTWPNHKPKLRKKPKNV
jgi:hypothetical protein